MEPSDHKALYESLKARCQKDAEINTKRYLGLLEHCRDMRRLDLDTSPVDSKSRLELLVSGSLGRNDGRATEILSSYLNTSDRIDSRYRARNRITTNLAGAGVMGGVAGGLAYGIGYLIGATWTGLSVFLGSTAIGAYTLYKLISVEHREQLNEAYLAASVKLTKLAQERSYEPLEEFEIAVEAMHPSDPDAFTNLIRTAGPVQGQNDDDLIRRFFEGNDGPVPKNMIN